MLRHDLRLDEYKIFRRPCCFEMYAIAEKKARKTIQNKKPCFDQAGLFIL